MTLNEKREQWEKGAKEILCVTHNVDGYKTVHVVASYANNAEVYPYQLLRYFKIGDNWEVSVDVIAHGPEGLLKCLAEVTTQFEDIRP
jgi:hypothetical protein